MKFTLSALILVVITPISAQVDSWGPDNAKLRNKIRQSSNKLVGELLLDKRSYLPGEEIRVELKFTNPEKAPLQVFDPFDIRLGSFQIVGSLEEALQAIQHAPFPGAEMRPVAAIEIVTFSPGETKVFTLDYSTSKIGASAPPKSRKYRITFVYGHLSADFEVRDAIVSAFVEAEVPLSRDSAYLPFRRGANKRRFQQAVSIYDTHRYYLCATIEPSYSKKDEPSFVSRYRPNVALEELLRYIAPFRCLATSDSEINEIDLSFSGDDSMLVLGKRIGDSMLQLRLDKTNKQIR